MKAETLRARSTGRGALNDQPFNDTRPAIDLPNTCENWDESVPTWTMLSQQSRGGSSQTTLDDVAGQSKDTGTGTGTDTGTGTGTGTSGEGCCKCLHRVANSQLVQLIEPPSRWAVKLWQLL